MPCDTAVLVCRQNYPSVSVTTLLRNRVPESLTSCKPSFRMQMTALQPKIEKIAVPDPSEDIERAFRAHHDRVFRAAYRVTGNISDAEDVLQTVFLRLLRHGHTFTGVDD